jgi:hypothetical protein
MKFLLKGEYFADHPLDIFLFIIGWNYDQTVSHPRKIFANLIILIEQKNNGFKSFFIAS